MYQREEIEVERKTDGNLKKKKRRENQQVRAVNIVFSIVILC